MDFEGAFEATVTPEDAGRKLVELDIKHIKDSDFVLVNLWKLSIGTIMEIVYAYQMKKTIIVICEKQYESLWLKAHCSMICRTVYDGIVELMYNMKERNQS